MFCGTEKRKKHPCLIPYEQLVDSEKDFDGAAALETIKVIIKLGFNISPPAPQQVDLNAGFPKNQPQGVVREVDAVDVVE